MRFDIRPFSICLVSFFVTWTSIFIPQARSGEIPEITKLITNIDKLSEELAELNATTPNFASVKKSLEDLKTAEQLVELTINVISSERGRLGAPNNDLEDKLEKLKQLIEKQPADRAQLLLGHTRTLISALEDSENIKYSMHSDVQKNLQTVISTATDRLKVKPEATFLKDLLDALQHDAFKNLYSDEEVEKEVKKMMTLVQQQRAEAITGTPGKGEAGGNIVIKSAWYGDHALAQRGYCDEGNGSKEVQRVSTSSSSYLPNDYSQVREIYRDGCVCDAEPFLSSFCSKSVETKKEVKNTSGSDPGKTVEEIKITQDFSKYCKITNIGPSLCFNKDPSPDSPQKSLAVEYSCGENGASKEVEAFDGATNLVLNCNG